MPPSSRNDAAPPPTLLLACAALAREVRALRSQVGLAHLDIHYLPAQLHNRPATIAGRVTAFVDEYLAARPATEAVVIGYGDCGTGGRLDATIGDLAERWQRPVTRLPGDHCYEFLTGADDFAALVDDEPATFFLTDFLGRHVDSLIWRAYRLDEHPELIEMMFGNYQRVVYLASGHPAATVIARGERFAARIGCAFSTRMVGPAPFRVALRTAGALA